MGVGGCNAGCIPTSILKFDIKTIVYNGDVQQG
jgi:hypothetical protein